MKPLRPASLVVQGLFGAFLTWLYVGDVVRFVRLQSAEVATVGDAPSLVLALLGSVVALGLLGTLGVTVTSRKPAAWRPRSLALVVGLGLLFLDFSFLSARRSPQSAEERLLAAVQALTQGANAEASPQSVPRDPALLRSFLDGLGPVPLFQQGERVAPWKVEVRERCTGPALEPGASPPGTLIYCVSGDRHRAWVTLVGTALGQTFGAPAIVAAEGGWLGEVFAAPEPAEEAAPPVWGSPTPEGEP